MEIYRTVSPIWYSLQNKITIQWILLFFSYAILSKTHTLPVANLLFTYYTKHYTEINRHLSQYTCFIHLIVPIYFYLYLWIFQLNLIKKQSQTFMCKRHHDIK